MHVNVSGRSALLFNKLIDWLIDTSVLSFILIHPNIWPQIHQRHRQTDRTDRHTTVPQHRANRFTNGRPKNNVILPVAMARSFSDDNTIRYVLPVCGWRHFCPQWPYGARLIGHILIVTQQGGDRSGAKCDVYYERCVRRVVAIPLHHVFETTSPFIDARVSATPRCRLKSNKPPFEQTEGRLYLPLSRYTAALSIFLPTWPDWNASIPHLRLKFAAGATLSYINWMKVRVDRYVRDKVALKCA